MQPDEAGGRSQKDKKGKKDGKDEPEEAALPGVARAPGLLLMAAVLWCPTLSWGQTDQRMPVELKVTLADGKIKIGKAFVDALRNRISRSETLVLSSSAIPRLILRISAEGIPGDPYLSVIAVTRTVAIPWKGGLREIFQDNRVMVGVSEAHASQDAADILEDTQRILLPKFTAIKGEKN